MQMQLQIFIEKHNASRHFGVSLKVILQFGNTEWAEKKRVPKCIYEPYAVEIKFNFITMFSNKTPQIAVNLDYTIWGNKFIL